VAALCADNSATDCVIVAAGDADADIAGDGDEDGEGVAVAARTGWQKNVISRQKIFITHKSQNLRV
jgi:hypothetical protein